MHVPRDSTLDMEPTRTVNTWLTRERLLSYSLLMIVLYALFWGLWISVSRGFTAHGVPRPGSDFSVFWTASHLILNASPRDIYDYLVFTKTERTLFSYYQAGAFLPWLYPPAYALVIAPLAMLPFLASYCAFVMVGVIAFVSSAQRVSGLFATLRGARVTSALTVLGCPCVFVTALYGQNALLTASLAAVAVYWIDRHPVRAGVAIGLLAFKPQMALVIPFVLIAARAWRVFGVAALTAVSFTLVGVFVCGAQSLHAFFASVSLARTLTLEHGESFWFASATPFAALRANGVPLLPAYIAHTCVAVAAITAACHVWRVSRDTRLRAASLTLATLLSNPYLWHYELTWCGLACLCMVAYGLEHGWVRGEQTILLAAWVLPLFEMFNLEAMLPQIGPVIVLLLLWIVVRQTDEHQTKYALHHKPRRGAA